MRLTSADSRGPTYRSQRLKTVWLLALPFLYLSRPSPRLLLVGALISVSGLLLRAYSAGFIHKDRELAIGGPYGLLRHPLYVGSFLLGLGLSLAGGRWWYPLLFSGLFGWLYHRTILSEETELIHRFGQEYKAYRGQVPAVIPQLRRDYTPPPVPGFRFWLYRRNKEWQASLGVFLGYWILWLKMSLAL